MSHRRRGVGVGRSGAATKKYVRSSVVDYQELLVRVRSSVGLCCCCMSVIRFFFDFAFAPTTIFFFFIHSFVVLALLCRAGAIPNRYAQRMADEMKAVSLQSAIDTVEKLEIKLTEFATKHQDEIRNDPVFRQRFLEMCGPLGVDPLVSSSSSSGRGKNLWNSLLGIGDFYHVLAVKVAEVCIATRSKVRRTNVTLVSVISPVSLQFFSSDNDWRCVTFFRRSWISLLSLHATTTNRRKRKTKLERRHYERTGNPIDVGETSYETRYNDIVVVNICR